MPRSVEVKVKVVLTTEDSPQDKDAVVEILEGEVSWPAEIYVQDDDGEESIYTLGDITYG